MSERDEMRAMLHRLLSEVCGPDERRSDERGEWNGALWRRLDEVGVLALGVPDDLGGSGGDLADAAVLLETAGAHGVPLPVAEHGFLGGWLLTASRLPLGEGVHTAAVAPHDLRVEGNRVSGRAGRVPWARHADRLVALADSEKGPRVVVVPLSSGRVLPGRSLAGEPRDAVLLDGVPAEVEGEPGPGIDADRWRHRAALARALMMAGAMDRVARITVEYSRVREQFGKPIGSFQAVKQHLVRISNESALARTAAHGAVAAALVGESSFETAAAKHVADVASELVVALAHQVHGAIGMTEEYQLQQFTRRLMTWRHEHGSARVWAGELGARVLDADADGLWTLVSGTTEGRDGLDFLRAQPVVG